MDSARQVLIDQNIHNQVCFIYPFLMPSAIDKSKALTIIVDNGQNVTNSALLTEIIQQITGNTVANLFQDLNQMERKCPSYCIAKFWYWLFLLTFLEFLVMLVVLLITLTKTNQTIFEISTIILIIIKFVHLCFKSSLEKQFAKSLITLNQFKFKPKKFEIIPILTEAPSWKQFCSKCGDMELVQNLECLKLRRI